jgi:hypothetical protein
MTWLFHSHEHMTYNTIHKNTWLFLSHNHRTIIFHATLFKIQWTYKYTLMMIFVFMILYSIIIILLICFARNGLTPYFKALTSPSMLVIVIVMVFNTTLSTISVISWWLIWLVEEILPRENHRPAVSHWQTLLHKGISGTPRHVWDSNSQH